MSYTMSFLSLNCFFIFETGSHCEVWLVLNSVYTIYWSLNATYFCLSSAQTSPPSSDK